MGFLGMSRILITGHKGLIGSSLWNRLQDDRELCGFDIVDHKENGFSKKVDMIIHCSSHCVIREVIKDTSLMMENINMTYRVMEKAKIDGAKVIFMSSSRLNSPCVSPYTIGKQFIESIAVAYYECYDVDSVVIRPETIWGYKENDRRAIPNWIRLSKNNEDIIVCGDETKELSPLFVEDFVDELIKIINNFDDFKNGFPVTITGEVMKVVNIIEIIKDFYNSKSKVGFLEPELSQPQDAPLRKVTDIILKNRLKERLR